jgi:predicted ATPase
LTRYILTGAPGAGKTVTIRQLEIDGFSVVEEAASDLIALKQGQGIDEPWRSDCFIDEIVDLQRRRLVQSSYGPAGVQFHDRSVICTAALAEYLGLARPLALSRELERVAMQRVYQPEVFFIRSLGFVAPTAVRRISLEDAIRFERVHEETYREFGFQIISIEPASPADRAGKIKAFLGGKAHRRGGE